ncbi:hypothetical protein JOQ06_001736, partial [Pogonophryne albipinna]
MDVTVYPPPPQSLSAKDHTRMGQQSYPDPAFGTNKYFVDRFLAASRNLPLPEYTVIDTKRVPVTEKNKTPPHLPRTMPGGVSLS